MSELWVVIPAAGESQRFKDAGYETPKPYLRIKDSVGLTMHMVNHVIGNLPPRENSLSHTIVAVPNMEVPPAVAYWTNQKIKKTKGQADTILQTIDDLPEEDSVLVLDCDMVLQTNDTHALIVALSSFDVAIAVTKTFDPNASRVDKVPFPTRFVEKEPISEYGIVGARAFKNIGLLKKALKRTIDRYATLWQEPYLSVAINHYTGTKFAHVITDYEDWGTPQRIKESGAEIVD